MAKLINFDLIKNSKTYLWIQHYLNLILIIGIPILFAPLPIAIQRSESYCGYIIIVMSLYWVTECIPVAITSLLPVLLFPLFKILSSKETSPIYFQDIQMLFFGGLVIAIGIENTGLHERIALIIIMGFGSDPKWLLLGIMTVTGFLSLWISNTAAASMMLPIVIALVKQLAKYNKAFSGDKIKVSMSKNKIQDVSVIEMTSKSVDNITEEKKINEEEVESEKEENEHDVKLKHDLPDTDAARNLMKGFCLSIAYSASIGGAGSLVGSTPNLLLKGFFDDKYPDGRVNFLTYMAFCLPISIIMTLVAWVFLAVIWLPRSQLIFWKKTSNKSGEQLKKMIKKRYDQLGPVNWEQGSIGFLFLLLVLLWLTRELFVIDGWNYFFESKKYVSDTTPAILIVILSFMWPKRNIFKGHKYEHLIKWHDMKVFPWDVILLGGGSLAMADGFEKSKLSLWVGDLLGKILPKNKALALIIILFFGEFGTEFTSNTSMASIFIPIADALAKKNGLMPHYFLLPLTVCVSLAFMLPVATQPNTIIFGSGYIKIKDMIISGFGIKIIGVFVLLFFATFWLTVIFGYYTISTALQSTTLQTTLLISNSTCVCC